MLKFGEQRSTRIAQRHIARLAIDLVCEAYGVSVSEILSAKRSCAQVSLARQSAMYLSHVVGQLSPAQVATEFNRDRSTVSHACHIIEDRRDSPLFEQQMLFLEKEFKNELINLYRNWLSTSTYHSARAAHSA